MINKANLGLIVIMILLVIGIISLNYELMSTEVINWVFFIPSLIFCFYLFYQKNKKL